MAAADWPIIEIVCRGIDTSYGEIDKGGKLRFPIPLSAPAPPAWIAAFDRIHKAVGATFTALIEPAPGSQEAMEGHPVYTRIQLGSVDPAQNAVAEAYQTTESIVSQANRAYAADRSSMLTTLSGFRAAAKLINQRDEEIHSRV